MKSKIIGSLLCIAVLAATWWLIRSAPSEVIRNTESKTETSTLPSTSEKPVEVSRAYVIETAHDAEDFLKRLAYDKDKSYEKSISNLVLRLEESSDYLKTELQDYYGATYFSKIAAVFRDVQANPFQDSATFGTRVGKMLTELENAYPADIAESANENDPENPMYYPKFDTAANGTTTLAMLAIYRQQYSKNTGSLLLTFGGNLMIGDTLLEAQNPDSFNNQQKTSKYCYPLYSLSSVLASDSVSFANLSSPLTESITSNTVAGAVKGLPSYSVLIRNGGVEVVSLSDTRMLSYGESGKSDTASALNQGQITQTDEGVIAYYSTSIGTVAYLSYNIIDEIRANVNQTFSEIPKADIATAKENGAKIVIVHFNWNTMEDDAWDPCKGQINSARAAVDNGADLVIGTAPDSISTVEYYNDSYIVYSPGNLYNRQAEKGSAFLFQQAFTLDANGNATAGEVQILPIGFTNEDSLPAFLLDAQSAKEFQSEIIKVSKTLKYGVNKRANFPVSKLNIISIQK